MYLYVIFAHFLLNTKDILSYEKCSTTLTLMKTVKIILSSMSVKYMEYQLWQPKTAVLAYCWVQNDERRNSI